MDLFQMLRSLIEQLAKPLVYKRRMPQGAGGGPIWVTPAAGLRYLFKPMTQIDPCLLSAANRHVKQGNVVWDIGANVGLFTLAAAYRAGAQGQVIAVEPDIKMAGLLERSRNLQNGIAPIEIVKLAVANSVGARNFNVASRSRSANFLDGYGSTQAGGVAETVSVQTVTLDYLAERFPLPDLLKIDVEGAEVEVLQGCSFLGSKKPIILCEVAEENVNKITAILHAYDYQLHDGDQSDRPVVEAVWNTVAIAEVRI